MQQIKTEVTQPINPALANFTLCPIAPLSDYQSSKPYTVYQVPLYGAAVAMAQFHNPVN